MTWIIIVCTPLLGFPAGPVVKNTLANPGDAGSVPGTGTGIFPGKISCMKAVQPTPVFLPMGKGAWRATVHGVSKELDRT